MKVYHNVLQFVPADLQQLHQYLEVEFNPLLLCKRVSPIIEALESDDVLKDYVEPLRETTLVRLIKEVSEHSLVWCLGVCLCVAYAFYHFPAGVPSVRDN